MEFRHVMYFFQLSQSTTFKPPIEKYTWQKATPTHDHSAFQKENAFCGMAAN